MQRARLPRIANRPKGFCDPLTFDEVIDAVRAPDGNTYGRSSITIFIHATGTVPGDPARKDRLLLIGQLYTDSVDAYHRRHCAEDFVKSQQCPSASLYRCDWQPAPWPTFLEGMPRSYDKKLLDFCFCCETKSTSAVTKLYNCALCGGVYCYQCAAVTVDLNVEHPSCVGIRELASDGRFSRVICCNACLVRGCRGTVLGGTPKASAVACLFSKVRRRPATEFSEIITNVPVAGTIIALAQSLTKMASDTWNFFRRRGENASAAALHDSDEDDYNDAVPSSTRRGVDNLDDDGDRSPPPPRFRPPPPPAQAAGRPQPKPPTASQILWSVVTEDPFVSTSTEAERPSVIASSSGIATALAAEESTAHPAALNKDRKEVAGEPPSAQEHVAEPPVAPAYVAEPPATHVAEPPATHVAEPPKVAKAAEPSPVASVSESPGAGAPSPPAHLKATASAPASATPMPSSSFASPRPSVGGAISFDPYDILAPAAFGNTASGFSRPPAPMAAHSSATAAHVHPPPPPPVEEQQQQQEAVALASSPEQTTEAPPAAIVEEPAHAAGDATSSSPQAAAEAQTGKDQHSSPQQKQETPPVVAPSGGAGSPPVIDPFDVLAPNFGAPIFGARPVPVVSGGGTELFAFQ